MVYLLNTIIVYYLFEWLGASEWIGITGPWFMISLFIMTAGLGVYQADSEPQKQCPKCGKNRFFDWVWILSPYKVTIKGKGEYVPEEWVDTTKTKSDGTHDGRYQETGYTIPAHTIYKGKCVNCEHNFTFKEYDYDDLPFWERSIRKQTDADINKIIIKGHAEHAKFMEEVEKDPVAAADQILKDLDAEKEKEEKLKKGFLIVVLILFLYFLVRFLWWFSSI